MSSGPSSLAAPEKSRLRGMSSHRGNTFQGWDKVWVENPNIENGNNNGKCGGGEGEEEVGVGVGGVRGVGEIAATDGSNRGAAGGGGVRPRVQWRQHVHASTSGSQRALGQGCRYLLPGRRLWRWAPAATTLSTTKKEIRNKIIAQVKA